MGPKKLSEKKWRAAFDSCGRITQFDSICKIILEHGIHDSIRGEVWEILLGCYSTFQTFEERDQIRKARRARYSELLEQCKLMNENLGSGKLPYSVNSKTMDIRKLSDEDRMGDAKQGLDRVTSLARLKMEAMLPTSPSIRLRTCSMENAERGESEGDDKEEKQNGEYENDSAENDSIEELETESLDDEILEEEFRTLLVQASGEGGKDFLIFENSGLKESDSDEMVDNERHCTNDAEGHLGLSHSMDLQTMKSLTPLGSGDFEQEINAEALNRLKEKELDLVHSLKKAFYSNGWSKYSKKGDKKKGTARHSRLNGLSNLNLPGNACERNALSASVPTRRENCERIEKGGEFSNDSSPIYYVSSNGLRVSAPLPKSPLLQTRSLDSGFEGLPIWNIDPGSPRIPSPVCGVKVKPGGNIPRSGTSSSEASPSGKKISGFFNSVLSRANSSGPELLSHGEKYSLSLILPKIFRSKSQDCDTIKDANSPGCDYMPEGEACADLCSGIPQSKLSAVESHFEKESGVTKSLKIDLDEENSKPASNKLRKTSLMRSGSDNTELTCELHNLHKTHQQQSVHPVVALGMEATEERVVNWLWILHKIVVDVVRTDRDLPFFNEMSNSARMCDILAVHAWVDPSTGFCQGMCDLLSPFLMIFEDDADAFWCFECLFSRLRYNFVMEGPVGVMRQLAALRTILALTDPRLLDRLMQIDADNFMFAFRMLLLLFRRELPFTDVMHLWEMMWAVDFASSDFSSLFHNAPQALNYDSLFSPSSQHQNLFSNSNSACSCNGGDNPSTENPFPDNELLSPIAVPSWKCIKSFVKCKHPLHMHSNFLHNGFTNSNLSVNSNSSVHSSPARPSLLLEWGELRDGDSNIAVFFVAAILRQNRKKLMEEIEAADDALKMFNDVEFDIDISHCIRTAIRIRNSYLKKLVKVPRQLPYTKSD